jgi:hypothetical protein
LSEYRLKNLYTRRSQRFNTAIHQKGKKDKIKTKNKVEEKKQWNKRKKKNG